MNKYVRVSSLITILFASATLVAAQASQADPFAGTWKLNLAKSKFKPGPAPKSETVTIAPDGKTTVEGETPDGKTASWSFTPSGDAAVSIQGLENSTVICKRTGNVAEDTWNFDGATLKARAMLSSNGKTITYTQTGTDKQGRAIHNVRVYDRASS
jgi:hypothetical protein